MLQITILVPSDELFDEVNSKFIQTKDKEYTLQLEHSLVSLSKWESKWCKPFLTKNDMPFNESADYIRCMTLTQNIDPEIYKFVTDNNILEVRKYIAADMTATTFSKDKNKVTNREIITAEIIYYWMITLNIPFECQKWHLNRLLTLINVCNIKNKPAKKMSKKEQAAQNTAINEARKAELHTQG